MLLDGVQHGKSHAMSCMCRAAVVCCPDDVAAHGVAWVACQ